MNAQTPSLQSERSHACPHMMKVRPLTRSPLTKACTCDFEVKTTMSLGKDRLTNRVEYQKYLRPCIRYGRRGSRSSSPSETDRGL